MAGLVAELIDVLNNQYKLYEELLTASGHKKEAVIRNDLDAIKAATSEEQKIVGKLQKSDKARILIMKDISRVLNVKESNITVSSLADTINDDAEAKRLRELARNLKLVLGNVKHLNDMNSALIGNALEYIDFSMNVIRSTFGDKTDLYSPNGAAADRGGFIDRKN